MPTECERSEASPAATTSGAATTAATTTQQQPLSTANIEQKDLHDMEMNSEMTTSTGSTSSSSTANGHNGSTSNGGKKTSITSPDPTAYVAKARVTRPTPPPPSYNPMQFVQIKPCNLYQTAQQQLKKAEEVKKIKEIKKEEPEDWQNNLDNWKSSRRKRVEHIIDRVVEVKKLELEEHDRSRRKSKTFSEMIEERGERGVRGGRAKLVSLAVYNEDESNDLSDLGIGTSSASGKSSLSEDYDNNSVMSDNADLDRAIFEHNHQHPPGATTREYISSPGYDTSSSTAPASSPDPCEYTYEGAIQDYKQRVSRATSGGSAGFKLNTNGAGATNGVPTSKEPTPERSNNGSADFYPTRRGSKIEERLIGFEVFSPNDSQEAEQRSKVDVPKIDISKRKEIFESTNSEPKSQATTSNGVPKVALRDRFQPTATEETNAKKEMKRLSGDITSSIKDRLQSLEQQQNLVNSSSSSSSGGGAKNSSSSSAMVVDVPVPPLKERLSSLQNAVTKEEVKKPPVVLVDARQLEIMKDEEENAKLRRKQEETTTTTTTTTTMTTILPMELSKETKNATTQPLEVESQMESEVDRDDSGIHVEEERLLEQQQQQLLLQAQEQQLNEAIAALVNEEKQLEEAANAVNQIEAEFAGLALDGSGSGNGSTSATTTTTNEHPCEMEFSVSSTNNVFRSPETEMSSSSSRPIGGDGGGTHASSSHNVVVVGAGSSPPVASSSSYLRRKPSNEMVHARNLLKMFKETFKNDIELDEEAEEEVAPEAVGDKSPIAPLSPGSNKEAPVASSPVLGGPRASSEESPVNPIPTIPAKPTVPQSPSMIPRSIGPAGKPPMSPKIPRASHPPRPALASPLASPAASRKHHEGQFSINGRVEIFNSKNMQDPLKPTSPTTPPTPPSKKSLLPQFVAAANGKSGDQSAASVSSNNCGRLMFPPAVAEPLAAANQALDGPKPMTMPSKASPVEEPPVTRCPGAASADRQPSASSAQPQPQTEVVVCAPPVTIVNPDELPKPNTVKALTSCFSQDRGGNSIPAPSPSSTPKPLPRSRFLPTPPQSPQPAKRNLTVKAGVGNPEEAQRNTPQLVPHSPNTEKRNPSSPEESKIESMVFNNNSSTRREMPEEARPHFVPASPNTEKRTPPSSDEAKTLSVISNSSSISSSSQNPSGPFETTAVVHSPPHNTRSYALASERSERPPPPVIATPSKIPPLRLCNPNESSLFKLAAASPTSPNRPSDNDIALCNDFFSSIAPCVSAKSHSSSAPLVSQKTVDEVPCDKIDIHRLPAQGEIPPTSCLEVMATDVQPLGGQPTMAQTKRNDSKPNSPIMLARAAHSKALIETCEKIIAEERQARSQMTPSLPSTPTPTPTSQKSTPVLGRKSRIPKPNIACCIGGSDSMTTADLEDGKKPSPTTTPETPPESKKDDSLLIARLHVVETQIKVTTTTPPASPKPNTKTLNSSPTSNNNNNNNKKTKNIFDFLKSHFGHHEPEPEDEVPVQTECAEPVDIVKMDEIFKVDNSKFYVAAPDEPTNPPPLPLTPAPVNIEITKKITTDEILEESTSELALSQEINDMLDEELNKLQGDPKHK